MPSKLLVAARSAIAATCAAREVGSAKSAAMPPAGMASTIDGITRVPAARAADTNAAVVSVVRLPSTVIVLAS